MFGANHLDNAFWNSLLAVRHQTAIPKLEIDFPKEAYLQLHGMRSVLQFSVSSWLRSPVQLFVLLIFRFTILWRPCLSWLLHSSFSLFYIFHIYVYSSKGFPTVSLTQKQKLTTSSVFHFVIFVFRLLLQLMRSWTVLIKRNWQSIYL